MLDRNQSTRISINEVVEHVWINSNTSLNYINTTSSVPSKINNSNSTVLNQSATPRLSDTQINKNISKQSKMYKPVLKPL
jgi:hypothetical protein